MADANIITDYTMRVSQKEFRLICLGLAGKITSLDDKKEAGELNIRLLEIRAKNAAAISEQAQKALELAKKEL